MYINTTIYNSIHCTYVMPIRFSSKSIYKNYYWTFNVIVFTLFYFIIKYLLHSIGKGEPNFKNVKIKFLVREAVIINKNVCFHNQERW